MSVKIRLMRVGKRKQPSYRVVVADGRKPRDGRFIEIIGHYGPRSEPSVSEIDEEKALEWLRKGAQPSEAVQKLFAKNGVWEQFVAEKGDDPAARYEPARAVRRQRHIEKAAAGAADEAPAGDEPAADSPPESDDESSDDETDDESTDES
ncbi:MAG: 30S ribosomal protein S16 [Acidimicrobiia bacterium]